jgi:acyl carrier protein
VSPSPGKKIDVIELQQHAASLLPEYMIPSTLSVLSYMPLTATGKIDRIQLPIASAAVSRSHTPPKTAIERSLAEMFEQVLEVSAPGITDNFFELGGHSLLATRLISRILGTFGVHLALRKLFESPTIRELAQVVKSASISPTDKQVLNIQRTNPLPLSFAQERIWYSERLSPGSVFNMPAALRLRGALDLNAFQGAFDTITERHEVLRTRFVEQDGAPLQCIDTEQPVEIKVISLRSRSPKECASEVRRIAELQAGTPFHLDKGPLLRVTLLDLDENEHVLIIVLHHIIADGWSISVLTRELVACYTAMSRGIPHALPPLQLQYGDFACWQREKQTPQILKLQRDYWANKLKGAPSVITLPARNEYAGKAKISGATVAFELPSEIGNAIRVHAQTTKTTVYTTLLTAYFVLLFRISGQSDLTIGSPVGHRPRPEFEPLIGLFLNMVPLRVCCDASMDFVGLHKEVHSIALDAFAHGDLPFEQIVNAAKTIRNASQSPLFNVVFVMQNAPSAELILDSIDITPVEFESAVAKYDITLALQDDGNIMSGSLEYATDIFDLRTAKQLIDVFVKLVDTMTKNPLELLLDQESYPEQVANTDDDEFTF